MEGSRATTTARLTVEKVVSLPHFFLKQHLSLKYKIRKFVLERHHEHLSKCRRSNAVMYNFLPVFLTHPTVRAATIFSITAFNSLSVPSSRPGREVPAISVLLTTKIIQDLVSCS